MPVGEKIYADAVAAIRDYSMDKLISGGVLVGLSGGADSVMLLRFLVEYRKRTADFPIVALHLNHMIRGSDAEADEALARECAESAGVEFISVRKDIPKISAKLGIGLEEAARNERYCVFQEIIRGRNDISCVAVAHNSTDNLETVIFNMMRGAGVRGLSGISPVRENIVRPLIYSTAADIRSVLDSAKIKYAVDKTNFNTEYTRNYIRHEILPRLSGVSSNPEAAVIKSSRNLRDAAEFISAYAKEFISHRKSFSTHELSLLPRAAFAEIMKQIFSGHSERMLEATHIDAIYGQLSKDNFSVSLPGGLSFVAERGECRIARPSSAGEFYYPLAFGENDFPEHSAKIFVEFENGTKSYSNVYKFSIQVAFPFDIIKGELYIRNKRDGDTYRTGGMTKKVKRMLCDADVPSSKRGKIPLLCDESGILWIPGFKVRDYEKRSEGKRVVITLALTDTADGNRFFTAKREPGENV